MINDCTALILAGGKGSRMGEDKAQLLLHNKTLENLALTKTNALFTNTILSVALLKDNANINQVRDNLIDAGPLAALVSGLAEIKTNWLFALAVDMPFVRESLIKNLANERAPFEKNFQAIIPIANQHEQVLCAFYAKSALSELSFALAKGERSVRRAISSLNVKYIEIAAPEQDFFDLDTPQDLLQARSFAP